MHSITVKAPAKVNLFLKVLGKRKDSYHNILTLFERISLADMIKISKIPKGIVVKSDRPITRDPKDNLVYNAAEAILKRGKLRSGVKIEIRKRIPIASGLGGGSSDAASTMVGINRLFRLNLDSKALFTIGKRLGADVPFFLLDTPFAIGRGRGDILEVVKSKTKFWHLIIKAGSKTATKDIYEAFDRVFKRLTLRPFDPSTSLRADGEPLDFARDGSKGGELVEPQGRTIDKLRVVLSKVEGRQSSGSSTELSPKCLTPRRESVRIQTPSKLRMDYAQAEPMLYNDLERAVSLKKGVISRILKSLAQLLGKKIIVSGSGPSLFCLYRTRREAIKARDTILRGVSARSRTGWQIFVARTQ